MSISRAAVSGKQNGTIKYLAFSFILIGCIVFAILRFAEGHVAAASTLVRSKLGAYCLDDYKNGSASGNKVMLWACNDSKAQNWAVTENKIMHYAACLSVQNNSKAVGAKVVSSICNDGRGQVWLKDNDGYFNPNSGLCLTALGPSKQLQVRQCGTPLPPSQSWTTASLNGGRASKDLPSCSGAEGQRVACYADKEWSAWQSNAVNHNDLLSAYTDGAPYESWCADFVSYVYKEAGYPFTQAYGGWDESNANNIQNYGFTLHWASSGYVPEPGDIAYFDYDGGHVEIVISGGKTPTFIYGNSATIDPATGNGEMKANTITNDGSRGKLTYYLSPD